MAQETISISISIPSLTAMNNSVYQGNIKTTAPSFPAGVTKWDSVDIHTTAYTSVSGCTAVTYVETSVGYSPEFGEDPVEIVVPYGTNVTSIPGSFKFRCKGTSSTRGMARFESSTMVFTYTVPDNNVLWVQMNGQPVAVDTVYRKVNGAWTIVSDPTTLDRSLTYVKGN